MKIKITLPPRSIFTTHLTVRISDVNYGGHLANDRVLSLCHEARIQLFRSVDASELDVGGVGIIMRDAGVVYQAEAFPGDELQVDVFMNNWGKCSFDLFYLLKRIKDGKDIAKAKTGIVFFNYKTRSIASTPMEFKEKLGNLLQGI